MCVFCTWFIFKMFVPLISQIRAESFPSTQGKILSAKVAVYQGSKNTYYRPSFRYTYGVNGMTYQGWRFRYIGGPTDNQTSSSIMRLHPPGTDIPVYYNPKNPADSVLSPMVEGPNFVLFFLFGPFILHLWAALIRYPTEMRWSNGVSAACGGMKIIEERSRTRVRMPTYLPDFRAITTFWVLSAGAAIYLAITLHNPISTARSAFIVVASISAGVYIYYQRRIVAGDQDLIIDEASRTCELPLTYGRRQRIKIPFSDVRQISLVAITHRRTSVNSYAPTLQLFDHSPQLLTSLSERRAESFAAWLRSKLGLPAVTSALEK
jgi:hypothetical protein